VTKGGVRTEKVNSKQIIYDALHAQEFRGARCVAIRDASEQRNDRPIYKRLVCNQCFLICVGTGSYGFISKNKLKI